jgi:hypothetical protein
MKWLTRLDVKDCPIDDAAVTWVLDSFPNLEHFAFTPSPGWNSAGVAGSVSRLEIVDNPNLKWLDMGDDPTSFIEQLRIVNAPDLALSLNISYANQLEIAGAPSLTGLAVNHPLPPGAELEGFRDLKFFAVGGPSVSDGSIRALADCESLSLITLAYPAKINTRYFAQLAQQSSGAAGLGSELPVASPPEPSAPFGTQVGRWIGGILFGGQDNTPPADTNVANTDVSPAAPAEPTRTPERTKEADHGPVDHDPEQQSSEPAEPSEDEDSE